jgi:hypothetical protein
MIVSVHRRSLRAALAACAVLLAGACAPGGPSAGPSPAEPYELEPAGWTAQSPAAEIAAWAREGCRRAPGGKDACLERTLVSLIDQAGISKSMEVLDTLAVIDADVKAGAHPLAHGLGIAAYRSPETLAATFAGCPVSQMSGCYHGVVQGYFLDLNRQGRNIGTAELDAMCNPHKENLFVYFQCAHGMGHGLMAVHANHLPMALEGCDKATDDFLRTSCYGGAFMENIVNVTHPHHTASGHEGTQGGHGGHAQPAAAADAHAGHGQQAAADGHAGHAQADSAHAGHGAQAADAHAGHGAAGARTAMQHGPWKALDRNDWLYPCNAVDVRYQDACYAMQTSAVMYYNYGDVAGTARVCDRAPEQFRATCFMSLGRDITAFAAQEYQRTIDMCERVGDAGGGRGKIWCSVGAVQTLVNQSADVQDGIRYCRLLEGSESKSECYRVVGEMTMVLGQAEDVRARSCQSVESEHVAVCRRAAGIPEQATGSE